MARQAPPTPATGENRLMQLVRLAADALLESPRVQVPGTESMTLHQLSAALRREALPVIEELQALQASVISISDVLADQHWSRHASAGQLGDELQIQVRALQDELARIRLTFDPDAPVRTYGQEPLSHIKELANEVQDVTGIVFGGHPRKVGALMLIAAAIPDLVERVEELEGVRLQ